MKCSIQRFVLSAAVVAFALPVVSMHAQPLYRQLMIDGYALGTPTPTLVRADAPLPHSGLTDPSLANQFNFTLGDGTNLNGVGNFIIPDPTNDAYIFSCTTARIGPRTILTAAHCVTDDQTGALFNTSGQSFARFLGPGSTNSTRHFYYTPDALQVVVNPFWAGFNNPSTYLANDFAVVNFASDLPAWITTYGLFTGFPIGKSVNEVGFGTYGGGTGPTDFDFGRRWGTNTIDYIPTDETFSDYLDIYTDFDDTQGNFDTFCWLGIACNSRYLATEAGTAEGDSGGPLFINGLIAGVASFGTYVCVDTAHPCTAFAADQSRPFDSFGSLHAYSPVFANADFIASATIPEPATVALLGMGLFAVAVAARRQRRS
jgi:hypothetical protein